MKLLKSKIAIAFFATLVTITPIFPQSNHTQQQKPQEDKNKRDDETIRIDTDLVTLTTTVVNERGRYVADLKQRDFAIYEDGVKPEVAYFNTGDKVPISLGVLFNTSGSMVDKIEGVRDAVEHFVKSVAPGDEIFLIRFSRMKSFGLREFPGLRNAQHQKYFQLPFHHRILSQRHLARPR